MSRRTARGVISRRTSPTAARTGLSPKGRGAEDGDPLTSRGRIRGAARQGKRDAGADNHPGVRRRNGGGADRAGGGAGGWSGGDHGALGDRAGLARRYHG